MERVLELSNIAANKNTVPGDKSALIPGGLRVGTPAMTSRGFERQEFNSVVEFIDEAVKIAKSENKKVSGSKFKDFKDHIGDAQQFGSITQLKREVANMAKQFPVVGWDESNMKYQ